MARDHGAQFLEFVRRVLLTNAPLARPEDLATFLASYARDALVRVERAAGLPALDDLRKALGVWYTPPEIVRYMVARVDAVLRSELGLADGLADENVMVLDPCCGTGAYLVETLRHIEATLRSRGDDALLAQQVKRAATQRVFGFEILPAPFVVAHLQLGMQLQQLGAPLVATTHERAGVYLTNALTGWEPREGDKQRLPISELEAERDAAAHIKRATPILVVLGNPPYNGFAGVAVEEERTLTTAYRTTKRAPAPQGQGLNDLYVRFFRMAERRIVEETGRGVVCFISNYSWLDGFSYTGMRERYLDVFDRIWIDNLHGDRVISEYAPDGRTSETIFAMQGTSPGIKLGTSIAMLVRKLQHDPAEGATILYRDIEDAKAADRRAALLSSLNAPDYDQHYIPLTPELKLGLPLKPREVNQAYLAWPKLPDLFPVSFPGIQTSRDDVVVDIDRDRLEARMRQYFDPAISHETMRRIAPGAMEDSARFNAVATRDHLLLRRFLPNNIVHYYYRPFDMRWLYWEPETKLLDEKRSEYFPHVFSGNMWIGLAQRYRHEFDPPMLATQYACRHIIERGANLFPLFLKPEEKERGLFDGVPTTAPLLNLSDIAQAYLTKVGALPPDLFLHAVAILHAPQYRAENGGALRQDWPRIPLPATGEQLRASAALGRRVAALLDVAQAAEGLGSEPLRGLGVMARVGGGQLQPEELAMRVGWGHRGENGVTMPGKGRAILRDRTPAEAEAIATGAAALGLAPDVADACLGAQTYDIFLNDTAFWRNVPERVWDYTIGGYQVIKKWLSYREAAVLGRPLTLDEAARDVPGMVRRIAALLLLGPALDANYRASQG